MIKKSTEKTISTKSYRIFEKNLKNFKGQMIGIIKKQGIIRL